MRPSIRNSDKEERAIFYQIMRCMQLPFARSDTLVGWTRIRTRMRTRRMRRPERVALPIPSNIVLSSQSHAHSIPFAIAIAIPPNALTIYQHQMETKQQPVE